EQVDDPRENQIDLAAHQARDQSDQGAHSETETDNGKPRQPRILNAEEDAREQVAADLVGAEPMSGRRRQIGAGDTQLWVEWRDPGRQHGDNRDDRHADYADALAPTGTPKEIAPV